MEQVQGLGGLGLNASPAEVPPGSKALLTPDQMQSNDSFSKAAVVGGGAVVAGGIAAGILYKKKNGWKGAWQAVKNVFKRGSKETPTPKGNGKAPVVDSMNAHQQAYYEGFIPQLGKVADHKDKKELVKLIQSGDKNAIKDHIKAMIKKDHWKNDAASKDALLEMKASLPTLDLIPQGIVGRKELVSAILADNKTAAIAQLKSLTDQQKLTSSQCSALRKVCKEMKITATDLPAGKKSKIFKDSTAPSTP